MVTGVLLVWPGKRDKKDYRRHGTRGLRALQYVLVMPTASIQWQGAVVNDLAGAIQGTVYLLSLLCGDQGLY